MIVRSSDSSQLSPPSASSSWGSLCLRPAHSPSSDVLACTRRSISLRRKSSEAPGTQSNTQSEHNIKRKFGGNQKVKLGYSESQNKPPAFPSPGSPGPD